MKRYAIFLALFLLIFSVSVSQAQEGVTDLDSLLVDFWPDFDDPSVLVLMAGTLPAGTPLPAMVTIPLPENARVNAAAYMDDAGKMMNAQQSVAADELTITTPVLNFRVEYYIPYVVEGNQHAFTFGWTSDNINVNQFEAKVQQPAAANALITEPAAANVSEGDDGLTYYVLPSQAIPAGQSYAINVNYNMTAPQLTVEGSGDATIDLQPAGPVPEPTPTRAYDWPLIAGVAGGVLVVVALSLLYFGNRPKQRVRKPRPARQSQKGASRFCHNCGESVGQEDRFCRQCGAQVKGK
ncbi:MAG: zinc ribbon domain-containing protein [Chloroflexi bacterium]|nr:zinc ribbon domain-containing protein [Chloroflexota bacterium]